MEILGNEDMIPKTVVMDHLRRKWRQGRNFYPDAAGQAVVDSLDQISDQDGLIPRRVAIGRIDRLYRQAKDIRSAEFFRRCGESIRSIPPISL